MASHIIKVSGVSDELLKLLDDRIQEQHATGRSEYIRELIRRDVLRPQASPTNWPSPDLPFRELLRPLQEEAAGAGDTEAATEEFLRGELEAHRRGGNSGFWKAPE